jgi:hypothetical protein
LARIIGYHNLVVSSPPLSGLNLVFSQLLLAVGFF